MWRCFRPGSGQGGQGLRGRRCYGLDKLETVVADMQIRIIVLVSRRKDCRRSSIARWSPASAASQLRAEEIDVPEGCFVEYADISARSKNCRSLADRKRPEWQPHRIGGLLSF